MNNQLNAAIPVYKLYGEKQHWPTPDLLHCELIAERSAPRNWYIPPHRHVDLLHVLYVREGEAIMHLEGNDHSVEGPNLMIIPAMAIHGWDFSHGLDGYVITVAKPLVTYLREQLEQHGEVLNKAAHYPLAEQREATSINTLILQVHEEYCQHSSGRTHLLHSLMQALTIQLARRAERRRKLFLPQQDKGHGYLVRFQRLVEAHYKEQPNIASLAKNLGITGSYLNTICQQLAGSSALHLLHERLLLEAKRLLTYTNMTISQVADELGFSEPAYFTRFFKRLTGETPKAFRQSH